jgi:TetR/AcrR family fatty acid metabolism transcriptional regulator
MAKINTAGSTKNRIINAARILFADQGYQKTTIAGISKQVGLSEAALYEYFKGKEDLLLTIPELWVSRLLRDLDEQLFGITGSISKLRKYLWWYLHRVEQAPLDAKIVYLDLKTNANFMATDVYTNVQKLYARLIDIFEEGKKTGELSPHLDPYLARDILIGTIDRLITRWLLKDRAFSLFDNLEEIFKLLLIGFKNKENTDEIKQD